MRKKSQAPTEQGNETKQRTPTFLLELPLQVNESQAARLRAHLEAGRQFYNAVLSEGLKRLRRMRADPAQAGLPVPSHAPKSTSGMPPSASSGNSMAFLRTRCMKLAKCSG